MADIVTLRHYMLEMRLDLSCVDTNALSSIAGRLEGLGLAGSTLEQERVADPEAMSRAYQCHLACRRRQPPTVLRQEPIPFARWLESVATSPDALPDAYFIGKAGEEYVGVCMLHRAEGKPHTLVNGFTGTLPTWGGRGVAKTLKACALLYAFRQGYRYVETSNLQVNRSMCAINRALGFQVVTRRLHAYRIPLPGKDNAKIPARS